VPPEFPNPFAKRAEPWPKLAQLGTGLARDVIPCRRQRPPRRRFWETLTGCLCGRTEVAAMLDPYVREKYLELWRAQPALTHQNRALRFSQLDFVEPDEWTAGLEAKAVFASSA
jgi:hypothetical protein